MNSKTVAAALVTIGICGRVFGGEDVHPGKSATNSPPATAATAPAKAAAPARDSRNAGQFTVIGYLEKRARVITIKSGPRGPVYSVATKNGKSLFENVSAEQLRAQAPELHELIRNGMASNASGRSRDARLTISAALR